jgi:hypothetical protein
MCGAVLPKGFDSCQALYDEVCLLELSDAAYASVALLKVDVLYILQHGEDHGPRSNAFHLMDAGAWRQFRARGL